jgi:uncharacterized RDD family membrane protein YckC
MSESETPARSDQVWRRLAAAVIDVVLFVAAGSFVAVALYAASHGALRSGVILRQTHCATVRAVPAGFLDFARLGVHPPPGFTPTAAGLCVESFLGLESGRYLTIQGLAPTQQGLKPAAVIMPLDANGRLARPHVLDWAYPLAFLLVMALFETLIGATPGKFLLGLRVGSDQGGRLPLHRALGRNTVIYGAWVLALVAPLLAALAGVVQPQWLRIGEIGVLAVLGWAALAMLSQAHPQALYDKWVGAEVVKV